MRDGRERSCRARVGLQAGCVFTGRARGNGWQKLAALAAAGRPRSTFQQWLKGTGERGRYADCHTER